MKKRSYNAWMKISTIVGLCEVAISFIPTFIIADVLSRILTKDEKSKYGTFIIAFLFFLFYTIVKLINKKNSQKIDIEAEKAKEEEGIL